MQLFGEIKDGKLILFNPEKLSSAEGERVIVNVHSLSDKSSEGQKNTLKMWLRIVSEETGQSFGSLYYEIASANMIASKLDNLKGEEAKKMLSDLEFIAADLGLQLPFPKKWNRTVFGGNKIG